MTETTPAPTTVGARDERAGRLRERLVGLARGEITGIAGMDLGLGYRDGSLWLRGHRADDLLDRYGSPLLVFDAERVRSNARALREAFGRHFSDVRLCYAMKACYVGPVLRTLLEEGVGLETMSDLELQLAQAHGALGPQLCSNGIGRSAEYNRRTAAASPFLTVVDAESDVAALERAVSGPDRLPVAVRVTPPSRDSGLFDRSGSKLGADHSGGSFDRVLQRCLASDRLHVAGLHAHQLTHCADLEQFRSAVRALATVAVGAERRYGIRFAYVDIGGGLESRFLFERAGARIEDFAAAAAAELAVLGHEVALVLEPGRWLVADAATVLCTVSGVKHNSGREWVIADAGASLLIPLPELVYHPLPVRLDGGPWRSTAVGDQTCDAQNVLCQDAELPPLGTGDRLALLNCGAYTTVFSSAWGHRLPTTLLVDGDRPPEVVFGPERQSAFWRALHGVDLTF
ncbi:hypothetical protein AB0K89_25775 [Streptomyces cinnamoneus]|uniref:diaminopimelate decarboxylase family protein n=1 Tax=Streptomyces cinnamoneus TaxID=53446 RepID=UPI00342CC1D3